MASYTQIQEDFALNPDKRKDLVQTLTPTSSDYYLYRLRLLSQELQQSPDAITPAAIEEFNTWLVAAENARGMPDRTQLEKFRAQLAILAYNVKPTILLKELNFDPKVPVLPASASSLLSKKDGLDDLAENLPSVLDPDFVAPEALTRKLLKQLQENFYDAQVPPEAWPHLFAQPEMESILLQKLKPEQLLKVFNQMEILHSPKSLEIIGKADSGRFDKLVVKMILRLRSEKQLAFSSNSAHFRNLTNAQLEKIRKEKSSVMDDEAFVGLLEKRIFPRPFATSAEEAHREWLDRMVDFVNTLSPKFNRHKVSVYLMLLEYDLSKGTMNKKTFLRYIDIPCHHEFSSRDVYKGLKSAEVVDLFHVRGLDYWSQRVKPANRARDSSILSSYITHFLKAEQSYSSFEKYFSVGTFLEPMLARVMLTSGDKNVAKWSKLLPLHENYKQLTDQTLLKFAPENAATFLPSDPVRFKLSIKNAKNVLVRVFEVKTFEYLQQHEGVVGESLDLDGLSPNWEHTLTLDYPPIEIHDLTIDLPELADQRGSFVMDVISNGENSSVYFTKGCLDYIERHSVAGHVLVIVDEKQEKIEEDCDIWFNGYQYKPNKSGEIIIPYRKPNSQSASYVYVSHKGFTTRCPFDHREESYTMDLSFHIDNESLVFGSTAKVLLKPIVSISQVPVTCPVRLLEQVVLEVSTLDTNGIETTTTVPDFKIYDTDWAEYSFHVPENLASVSFILQARIKVISTSKHQDLSAKKRHANERPGTDLTVMVEQKGRRQAVQLQGEILTLLRKNPSGYEILVLGKNGEKRPDTPIELAFGHPYATDVLTAFLRTDAEGVIQLGPLLGMESVHCKTTDIDWPLSSQQNCLYARRIHGVIGEPVRLPLTRMDAAFVRNISLFSVTPRGFNERCVLDDLTSQASAKDGLLVIKDLKAGYYSLQIGGDYSVDIVIANAGPSALAIKELADFHLRSNPMLEVPDYLKHPLFLPPVLVDQDQGAVEIRVRNWSPETRVCVVASKFLPSESMFTNLAVQSIDAPWSRQKANLTPTTFSVGRILGEEYQYILNRKAQKTHWAGNLLPKPSVLLTPWSVSDTNMGVQTMRGQNLENSKTSTAAAFGAAGGGMGLGKGGAARHRRFTPKESPPLLHFLVHPSVMLANLIPDATTGILRLPIALFKEGTFLQVFASDGPQAIQQSLVIPRPDAAHFKKQDLRFMSPLDHRKHYIGERAGLSLDPRPRLSDAAMLTSPSITLASNGSSSSAVRVINSVSQVYDLMLTLMASEAHKRELKKFGFIVDWHRLSMESKNEKFSTWCSHELNLFLYKKDRPYFDAVVAPFLKNKLVKSFMDDYLIGSSLDRYTSLKEVQTLSCLEKCLLAQRVPRLRPTITKWLRDRVHNPRAASNVKLFRTVMKSGALEDLASDSFDDDSFDMARRSKGAALKKKSKVNAFLDMEAMVSDDDDCSDEEDFEMVSSAPSRSIFGYSSAPPPPRAPRAMNASACPPPPPPPPSGGLFGQAPGARAVPSTPSGSSFAFGSAAPMQQSAPAPALAYGLARRSAPLPSGDRDKDREAAAARIQDQFQPIDLTKEMAETYYYGRQDASPILNNSDLNAFWLDFAGWNENQAGSGTFLSENFVANAGTFTDAMATIALLDLDFKPKETTIKRSADQNLVVSSQSAAIVFHSSTKEQLETPVVGSVLVTQQYFLQRDKTVYDEKLRTQVRSYIKPGSEFRTLESYGAHVVLMNATPNPMNVHVEVQLPQGSISIYKSLETAQDIKLQAHATFQYEYGFYFPEAGDFSHYPPHVSDYEDIIAFGQPSELKVRAPGRTNQAKEMTDTTTWSHVLVQGSNDQVLAKLASSPIQGMPVELLIPRLYRDKNFFLQVTSVLRSRHEFSQRIWSVCLALPDQELLREYLSQLPIAQQVGDWFTSALLVRRPRSRYEGRVTDSFQYLEYFPMINARAHKATKDATILNDKFKVQYGKFLGLLSQKPKHDMDDLLVLIVYLLAQDRVLEAKEKFVKLSALVAAQGKKPLKDEKGSQLFKIQYDYLQAYLSLCVEVQVNAQASDLELDLESIQAMLVRYKDYPVKRWRKMFEDMQKYVDDILQSTVDEEEEEVLESTAESQSETDESGWDDLSETTASLAIATPSAATIGKVEAGKSRVPVTVDFKIGSDSVIRVRHRGVREVQVEYYSIDAETMFSASPLTFSDQGESETTNATANTGNMPSRGRYEKSTNSYRLVKPNGVDKHAIPCAVLADGMLEIPILKKYLNTNVMISVSTTPPAATRSWKAYYSQTMAVQCLEQTGTIKVISKGSSTGSEKDSGSVAKTTGAKNGAKGRPIRGGYVKVYAEMKHGVNNTVFWKDGYTDLVGRFAYAQVSTASGSASAGRYGGGAGGLKDVKRFVVFVDGGEEGCMVKTVPVPPV